MISLWAVDGTAQPFTCFLALLIEQATIMELLQLVTVGSRGPFAVCCGSRDSLDLTVERILQSQLYYVAALVSSAP